MAIQIDVTRPLTVIDETISLSLARGTGSEDDTSDYFRTPFCVELSPDPFDVASVIATNGSPVLEGDFTNFDIRQGDEVTGASIDLNTTVVSATTTQVTLSNPAIASSGETLTFAPAAFTVDTVTVTSGVTTIDGDFSSVMINVGDGVSGPSIALNSTVTAVTPTQITLDFPAIASNTETITFTPATFDIINALVVSGSTVVDADFSSVTINTGDGVSGVSIAVGSTVSAVSPTQITLNLPATGSSAETINFNPGTFLATLVISEIPISANGALLTFNQRFYYFDGTIASAAKLETVSNAINSADAVNGASVSPNMDQFLLNARVARS